MDPTLARPLLATAAGLVIGDLAGLRSAAGGVDPVAPGLAIAALLGIACALALRPAAGGRARLLARPGSATGVAVLASAFAGLALGGTAGNRSSGSCLAALQNGDPLAVAGRLSTAVDGPIDGSRGTTRSASGTSRRRRWLRTSLSDVLVMSGGRRCRLPELGIRLRRSERPAALGALIVARGTWRDYGSRAGGWPRPLDRYGTAYVELVASAPAAGPVGDRPSRTPTGLRARAGARLERSLPEEAAPLAKALVLAERDDVDPTVTRQFADAGLVHVLAISGLHVGILAAVATWLIGFVTRRASRYLVAAFLVGAYVIFIGSPPSAVRAALLFAGYATARARRAPAATGDLVGLAAIIAVVADPLVVLRPGFQLSYAGFGGLVAGNHAAGRLSAGAVPLSRRLPRRAVAGLRVMLAGTGAFVCTAPIAAAHFGRVSPASILSTPVAVPLVALSLVALFGALLLPSFLADLAADAAAGALTLLRGAVELFGALPLHGPASAPPPFDWLGLGLLFLALGTLVYARSPMRAAVPLGAAFAASAVAPWIAVLPARGATLLCSLDVGQGDAAVIRTRRGRWIVVDAGPGPGFHASTDAGASSYAPERDYRYGDAGRRVVVPFLRARGARAVELFVLSHPHLDHLGGAAGLFEEMPVRRVLDAGYPLASRSYLGFLQRVEAEGAEWLPGRRGARVAIDEVEILVLAPDAEGEARVASAAPPEDPNDVSLIVRMRIDGGFTYLNTGDAPAESETTVLAGWPADSLQAELLKLGHHGSRTSTRLRWLTAVEPRIAVISAGRRNRYGHPHASTLARLDSARIERVWRTDRQGTLCIRVAAGGRWRLEPG